MSTGTGTITDPIIAMSPDPVQIAKDIRASLFHFNRTDDAYWMEKESTPAQFSNGLWHLGHNRYWETAMEPTDTGSRNPADGRLPALYRTASPVPAPDPPLPDPPSAPPDENAAGVLALLLARQDSMASQLTVLSAQLSDILRLLRVVNAPVYEGKIKIPYLGTGTVTLTPVGALVKSIIGTSKP